MTQKYRIKILEKVARPSNQTDTVMRIYRKDKKMIKGEKEGDNILKQIKKAIQKKGTRAQFLIRARNIYRMSTLKGFDNDEYQNREEDYYQNEVDDSTEFEKYSYFEITIRQDN